MNCEQVREHLSAYLDHQLAQEERVIVLNHLKTCHTCKTYLLDLRRFDALIARLPRIIPDDTLREKIFSSSDYRELTGTFGSSSPKNQPTVPGGAARSCKGERPHLVALPTTQPLAPQFPSHPAGIQRSRYPRIRSLHVLISILLFLTISLGIFLCWRLWPHPASYAANSQDTLPPGDTARTPLPGGPRFVFLRDNALWSAPGDGSGQAVRLTSPRVAVAKNWRVRPPLPGRSAGNMLAYVNLQDARIHLLQSNGEHDTILPQPLLKPGVAPATTWDTYTGAIILNSLAWSHDGSMLAFVADPGARNQTTLFIYTVDTDTVQMVSLPWPGKAAQPVWSPDNIRIAFLFHQQDQTGILDYNVQNHGLLTITQTVATVEHPDDTVLSLAWSPDTSQPALTWSVGNSYQTRSIWWQRVGVDGPISPRLLTQNDYIQASYNANSYNGTGGWLLLPSQEQAIITINLDAQPTRFTPDDQATAAIWSPDGAVISYLSHTEETKALHAIQTTSGRDTLIATHVIASPLPAWSPDSRWLVYNTEKTLQVTSREQLQISQPLPIQGIATTFCWSVFASNQLVFAISEGTTGTYQANIATSTARRLDTKGVRGPIHWTQGP